MRMAERGLVNFGRCSPNRRLDDCTCDLEAAAKLSRSYLSPCDHKPQSPSFRISSNETQGMKMRNAHSGVFHQYSAFRVPQSAFPIPHFPGSEIRVSHLSYRRSPLRISYCQLGAVSYDRTIVFESAAGGLGLSICSAALLDRYFWSDR